MYVGISVREDCKAVEKSLCHLTAEGISRLSYYLEMDLCVIYCIGIINSNPYVHLGISGSRLQQRVGQVVVGCAWEYY